MFLEDMRLSRLVSRLVEAAGLTCTNAVSGTGGTDREEPALAIIGLQPARPLAHHLDYLRNHAEMPVLLLGDSRQQCSNALQQAHAAGLRHVRFLRLPQDLELIDRAIHSLLPVADGDSGNGTPPANR